jgi:hypothetical protein
MKLLFALLTLAFCQPQFYQDNMTAQAYRKYLQLLKEAEYKQQQAIYLANQLAYNAGNR